MSLIRTANPKTYRVVASALTHTSTFNPSRNGHQYREYSTSQKPSTSESNISEKKSAWSFVKDLKEKVFVDKRYDSHKYKIKSENEILGRKFQNSREGQVVSYRSDLKIGEDGIQGGVKLDLLKGKASSKTEIGTPTEFGGGTQLYGEVGGTIFGLQIGANIGEADEDSNDITGIIGFPMKQKLLTGRGDLGIIFDANRIDGGKSHKAGASATIGLTGVSFGVLYQQIDARTGGGRSIIAMIGTFFPTLSSPKNAPSEEFLKEMKNFKQKYIENSSLTQVYIQEYAHTHSSAPWMDGPDHQFIEEFLDYNLAERPASEHSLKTRNEETKSDFRTLKTAQDYIDDLGIETYRKS